MSKFRKFLYGVRRRSRGKERNYTSGNVYSPAIRMGVMTCNAIVPVKMHSMPHDPRLSLFSPRMKLPQVART